MKYLKRFNESNSEVYELAKDSMVELMDNGFNILLRSDNEIWILPDTDRCFEWSEVENYIINFLNFDKVESVNISYHINRVFDDFTIMPSEIIGGTINNVLNKKTQDFNSAWGSKDNELLISVVSFFF